MALLEPPEEEPPALARVLLGGSAGEIEGGASFPLIVYSWIKGMSKEGLVGILEVNRDLLKDEEVMIFREGVEE